MESRNDLLVFCCGRFPPAQLASTSLFLPSPCHDTLPNSIGCGVCLAIDIPHQSGYGCPCHRLLLLTTWRRVPVEIAQCTVFGAHDHAAEGNTLDTAAYLGMLQTAACTCACVRACTHGHMHMHGVRGRVEPKYITSKYACAMLVQRLHKH